MLGRLPKLLFGTLDDVPSAYQTGVMGDNVKNIFCDPTGPGQLVGQGTGCPLGDLPGSLVNVSATLHPRKRSSTRNVELPVVDA